MRKTGKILSLFMALVLILSASGSIKAKADTKFVMTGESDPYKLLMPGETLHVSLSVKTNNPMHLYSMNGSSNNNLIQVENIRLLQYGGEKAVEKYDGYYNLYSGTSASYVLEFDVIADDALEIGENTVSIFGYGEYFDGFGAGKQELELVELKVRTDTEKQPAELVVSSVEYDQNAMIPGGTTNLTLTVRNEGEIKILNTYMTLEFGSSGIIPNYSVSKVKVGDLAAGASQKITVKVKVLDSATAGLQRISASFTGKNKKGVEQGPFNPDIYINIKEVSKDSSAILPILSLSTEANYGELKRGGKMTIPITIKNDGKAAAKSITIAITEGVGSALGITKDYTSSVLDVDDIAAGKSKTVKVPITVSEDVAAGLHEFAFEVKYKNDEGSEMTPATMSMYLEAQPKPEEDKKPDLYNYLDIHNVSQSPSNPEAGSKISISFEITNNGNGKVKNLRVFGQNLSSNGFEPLTNEPYQTVGDLAAGASKKTSMTFKVGENIESGTNSLTIGYEFIDENGEKKTDSASIYILNVDGRKDDSAKDVGRPKLIISDYSTDQDVLRAGETFDFSFSIKNTHQTKAAKNIKVTVSQAEGIFSPAAGTNIFYVDEIGAGQISVQTMNLKTRADATTGDYEISIKLEYEYDDMSTADREKGGVSEENAIKLRATENYRPVIENIRLDAWEGCYLGVPVDMNFEFYNMGKSTLGNVYVTVEGDFALANNSQMSYVGAIQGYGQEFINPQVVALVEGDATGILTVHFEDSNGDEVTLSQEFTQFVQSMGGGDWGGDMPVDPDFNPDFDPGQWDNPEFNPDGEGGEEGGFFSKIKPWMWVCGASVIVLAVAIPLIVHGVKKSKKGKVDEDEDY
ncbi:MAG: hypothetical protein K6E62_11955 [Lachnospiraceae bacterium]|nr:hypothetical protein [Lachnospiraceae bacterium]